MRKYKQKYPNGVTMDELFKNPILRVSIIPIEDMLKIDPDWRAIDRLDELWKDSGLFESIKESVKESVKKEDEEDENENIDNCRKTVRCA